MHDLACTLHLSPPTNRQNLYSLHTEVLTAVSRNGNQLFCGGADTSNTAERNALLNFVD